MKKKLLAKRKNNKGFSLVELIVVVLIIAIIAVALAPQVMKWVGTSKENVDKNNAASFKTAINSAVADYLSTSGVSTITEVKKSDDVIITGARKKISTEALTNKIEEALNGKWPNTEATNKGFRVSITSSGAVDVEYDVNGTWTSSK